MRGATGICADVVDVDDRRTRLTKPLRHNQREPKSLPPLAVHTAREGSGR